MKAIIILSLSLSLFLGSLVLLGHRPHSVQPGDPRFTALQIHGENGKRFSSNSKLNSSREGLWPSVGHMLTPWTKGQGDEGRLMAQAGSGTPTLIAREGPVSRRMGEGHGRQKQ